MFVLRDHIEDAVAAQHTELSRTALLALLRLSGFDADLVRQFAAALFSTSLPQPTPQDRHEWLLALLRVYDNCDPQLQG